MDPGYGTGEALIEDLIVPIDISNLIFVFNKNENLWNIRWY